MSGRSLPVILALPIISGKLFPTSESLHLSPPPPLLFPLPLSPLLSPLLSPSSSLPSPPLSPFPPSSSSPLLLSPPPLSSSPPPPPLPSPVSFFHLRFLNRLVDSVDCRLLEKHSDAVGSLLESSPHLKDKIGFEVFERLFRFVSALGEQALMGNAANFS